LIRWSSAALVVYPYWSPFIRKFIRTLVHPSVSLSVF